MPHPFNPENAIHPATRAEWRQWLEHNHHTSKGIWFVFGKKGSGLPLIPYEEAVMEALCFGWVDGKAQGVDEKRHALWMAPRKAGSAWSKPNKERVERLCGEGLMMPAGQLKIDHARQTGDWDKLNEVDNLTVPDDLNAAFARYPGSAEYWEAFPKSIKQMILQWIGSAKRLETRQARLEDTAAKAARNERANQWVPPQKR